MSPEHEAAAAFAHLVRATFVTGDVFDTGGDVAALEFEERQMHRAFRFEKGDRLDRWIKSAVTDAALLYLKDGGHATTVEAIRKVWPAHVAAAEEDYEVWKGMSREERSDAALNAMFADEERALMAMQDLVSAIHASRTGQELHDL